MGIVNHMLNVDILGVVVPNSLDADETNSEESIQKQVDLCEGQWGRRPNVVLVSSLVVWCEVVKTDRVV